MMPRVASLTGTASPSPTPATAGLIPTTRGPPSASAPPEVLTPGAGGAAGGGAAGGLAGIGRRLWRGDVAAAPRGRGRGGGAGRRRDPRRDRAREPVRVADRDDELPDLQGRGVAELG